MLLVPNYMKTEEMLDYPVVGGVLNGYRNRKDLFLNDNISRLALITLKSEVREPGAQSKMFAVALSRAKMNKADTREWLEDCETSRYQEITIKDKKDLKFYRFLYFQNKKGNYDEYIDKNRDDLIGKKLKVRMIISCDGEYGFCAKCYGANSAFARDNSIFKVNVNDYTLVLIAGILQGIISIKHHLSGQYMNTVIKYDNIEYTMQDFVDKMDFISDINYNVLNFTDLCEIDFIREKEEDRYESLFVDGIKVEYPYEIKKVNKRSFKLVIPNDSVMRRADNLITALSKHRRNDYHTGEPDFSMDEFLDLDVDQQMAQVIGYLKDRIKLHHINHYAISAYSMTRDYDNKSSRVTKDTQRVDYIQTNDILIYPDRNHSVSGTLPYGRIRSALESIFPDIREDEYDLLYSNLLNKEPSNDSTYREMNRMLSEAIKRNDEYYETDATDEGVI